MDGSEALDLNTWGKAKSFHLLRSRRLLKKEVELAVGE